MDSGPSISASEASRRLGTSVPRVKRAVLRAGLAADGPGGRVRLGSSQMEALREVLGVDAQVPGLGRIDARVLAALSRAPRGLGSVRSVAVRAGVSPTAAGRALARLEDRQLVRRERTWVAAGRAREADLLYANLRSPDWPAVASRLANVEPPIVKGARRLDRRVPPRLRHLFWNTDPAQLDVKREGDYIARRLIQAGDLEALAWGAEHLSAADWHSAAATRGLTDRLRSLARNLAESKNGDEPAR